MFIESPPFPQTLSYGGAGGPTFATTISAGASAAESRVATWTHERGVYEVGLVNRSKAETIALISFFRAVAKGRAVGFRFRDFGAGESTGTSELIGTGDGTTRVFQLVKWYASGSLSTSRTITKPVSGTVLITVNGTATTAFWVSTEDGTVHLDTAPTAGQLVRASFTFDVPVRLDTDKLTLRRIDSETYSWESVPLTAIRDGVPTVLLPEITAPPTKYAAFTGDVTAILTIPNATFFNAWLAGATHLTVVGVLSHLTTGGTFLYVQQEGAGESALVNAGATLELAPGGLVMHQGAGAAEYGEAFSMGGWTCLYTPRTSPSATLTVTPAADATHLQLFAATFDWQNSAVYSSGSFSGYDTLTRQTFNSCTVNANPALHPTITPGATVTTYQGRDGGFPVGYTAGINQDVAVAITGMVCRLYDVLLLKTVADLSPTEVVTQIHRPLLAWLTAIYTSGTIPSITAVPATSVLWFRADKRLTLGSYVTSGKDITAWGNYADTPLPSTAVINLGFGVGPSAEPLGTLPVLTDTMVYPL